MSYYSKGNISVDAHFARFGEKSYAIDKINSVEVRSKPKAEGGGLLLCSIIALIAAVVFFNDPGMGSAVVFALSAGGAYLCWQEMQKRIYSLYLMTSSSEAQAIATEDGDDIDRLRRAIESAMTKAAPAE